MIVQASLRRRLIEAAQVLTAMAMFVAGWEIIVAMTGVAVWLLPSPSAIWTQTLVLAPVLPQHIMATTIAILGGFFLAIFTAVPIAIAVVFSPLLNRILYPPLLALQSVPKVAIAPLFLIWIGYGIHSNIVIAATIAFFPILINTATGLSSVNKDLLDLTRSFGSPAYKVFWKLRLPWSMPYFFSSLRVAITFSVIGAIVGEFIGADRGLGYLILSSLGSMNTAAMFGILVIMSLIAIAFFYIVVASERIICPWYEPE